MLLPSKERPKFFSNPPISKPIKLKTITKPPETIIYLKNKLESNSILIEPKIANTSMIPPKTRIAVLFSLIQ